MTLDIANYRRGLGLVTIGSGGSASSFHFDPSTGLSDDPNLAFDLQGLTPAQLQTALTNPSNVTSDLISLLNQSATGTGAGTLPCGDPTGADPTCTGGVPNPTGPSTTSLLIFGVLVIGMIVAVNSIK